LSYLSLIRYENYKNLEDQEIKFSNRPNIFIGPNGSGKTNVLESVSLFLPGKGFKKQSLENITKFNSISPWAIFGKFKKENLFVDILTTYKKKENNNIKKESFINGEKQKKFLNSNIIPPILWFIPEMERLFSGPPSLRRNFIDRIVYSFDSSFLNLVKNYLKLLKERKNIIEGKISDENWLNQVEEKIAKFGIEIIYKRNETINLINKNFLKISLLKKNLNFCKISFTEEFSNDIIRTENNFAFEKYLKELKNSRKYDMIVGGCKIGPHKSDIEVIYSKNNLKASFCSTGEQKKIILSIILCQSYCLKSKFKIKPIVLLDEICSHLDNSARSILLDLTDWLNIQVLMTGTQKNFFSFLSKESDFFTINNGNIKKY